MNHDHIGKHCVVISSPITSFLFTIDAHWSEVSISGCCVSRNWREHNQTAKSSACNLLVDLLDISSCNLHEPWLKILQLFQLKHFYYFHYWHFSPRLAWRRTRTTIFSHPENGRIFYSRPLFWMIPCTAVTFHFSIELDVYTCNAIRKYVWCSHDSRLLRSSLPLLLDSFFLIGWHVITLSRSFVYIISMIYINQTTLHFTVLLHELS